LSATLYQLMTNVVPVDALSRADSMLNGMPDPIHKISDLTPEISPAVSAVILQGMEVSQEKRFATARDMQKALRKADTAMQEAMAAQTMVYSGPEAAKEGGSSNIDTTGAPSVQQPPPATLTPDMQAFSSGAVASGFDRTEASTPPNFDASPKREGGIDS